MPFPSCLWKSSFHEIHQVFQSCLSQFCLLTLVCRLVTLCCFACSKRWYLEIIIDLLLRFVVFIPVIIIVLFFNLRYLPFNNYKVIQPVIIIFHNRFLGFLGLCSRFRFRAREFLLSLFPLSIFRFVNSVVRFRLWLLCRCSFSPFFLLGTL